MVQEAILIRTLRGGSHRTATHAMTLSARGVHSVIRKLKVWRLILIRTRLAGGRVTVTPVIRVIPRTNVHPVIRAGTVCLFIRASGRPCMTGSVHRSGSTPANTATSREFELIGLEYQDDSGIYSSGYCCTVVPEEFTVSAKGSIPQVPRTSAVSGPDRARL